MSDEFTGTSYVKQYIEAERGRSGGAVLLARRRTAAAGRGFYRRAMAFQEKYADGKKIRKTSSRPTARWSMRSGATCLPETISHAGVGFTDGPQDIHDTFRLTKGAAKPTFERVMQTIGMFRRSGVECQHRSVVNKLEEGRGGRDLPLFPRYGAQQVHAVLLAVSTSSTSRLPPSADRLA